MGTNITPKNLES